MQPHIYLTIKFQQVHIMQPYIDKTIKFQQVHKMQPLYIQKQSNFNKSIKCNHIYETIKFQQVHKVQPYIHKTIKLQQVNKMQPYIYTKQSKTSGTSISGLVLLWWRIHSWWMLRGILGTSVSTCGNYTSMKGWKPIIRGISLRYWIFVSFINWRRTVPRSPVTALSSLIDWTCIWLSSCHGKILIRGQMIYHTMKRTVKIKQVPLLVKNDGQSTKCLSFAFLLKLITGGISSIFLVVNHSRPTTVSIFSPLNKITSGFKDL